MHKLWIGFLAAASAVCFWMLAKTGTDAAKLLPARVLVIEERDGAVRVSSDNGAAGSGETLAAALKQMEQSALDASALVELLRAHPGKLTLSQAHAALLRGEPLRPAVLKLSEEGGVMLGK